MQEGAAQSVASELGVAFAITIFVVAEQRMAGVRGVNPDLMRSSRRNIDFHESCELPEELHRLEDTDRRLAAAGNTHVPLAVFATVGRQRRIDPLGPQLPTAGDQREIGLVQSALADQCV